MSKTASEEKRQQQKPEHENTTVNNDISAKVHNFPTTKPIEILKEKSQEWGLDLTDVRYALKMDQLDPLKGFRDKFHYPKMKHLPETDASLISPDEDCVYLCGNSLGLMPKGVRRCVERELDKWAKIGVHGHVHGEMPWALCDECIDERMANLVGAKREEVAVMNGLTINQHLLLISFYRPTLERHKILMESHAFPSDHYAVESQIRFHGYDPKTSLICMTPREGEQLLRIEDIEQIIQEHGDSIAVVMWPGVQYYTGQLFDMARISRVAKAKGCYVGFDLAHAVGNVEIKLHEWDIDFACWCSYKYVNSGAGGIAGIFIHEKYANNDFPKLHGWWSHRHETRFNMNNELDAPPGPRAYRISNPPPLLCAPLEASLEVYMETSMSELCNKSRLLTGYLELLLKHHYPKPQHGPASATKPYVEIITPSNPEERGCQLSVVFSVPIAKVFEELKKRGVVLDKREPNVLRVAPTPLYNSFNDVFRFVRLLGDAMEAARL